MLTPQSPRAPRGDGRRARGAHPRPLPADGGRQRVGSRGAQLAQRRTATASTSCILRPDNEFLPALNHGIAATSSDPFMVTDPDLVVPDLDPAGSTADARHPGPPSRLRPAGDRARPVQPAVGAGARVDRPARGRRRRDRRAAGRQRLHADPPRRAALVLRDRLGDLPERRAGRLPLRLDAGDPRRTTSAGTTTASTRAIWRTSSSTASTAR